MMMWKLPPAGRAWHLESFAFWPIPGALHFHQHTPCREFAEETLGLFASSAVDAGGVALSHAHMAQQLRDRRHVLQIQHHLKKVPEALQSVFHAPR